MDPAHIARLKEEQELAYNDTTAKISQWNKFNDDYSALQDRLKTLPDKVTHEVMVPFGPLAFMPGQIIHSNEITVLLGDNWFAERSAKQACEIIDRRKNQIEDTLKDLEEQKRLLGDRLGFTSEFKEISESKEGIVDIQEEYDPEKERVWREERKRRSQDVRKTQQLSTSKQSSKPDHPGLAPTSSTETALRTKHKHNEKSKDTSKKSSETSGTRRSGQNSKVIESESTKKDKVDGKRAMTSDAERLWARLDELERQEEQMDELARLSDYEESEEEKDQPMFSFVQEASPEDWQTQKPSKQLQRSNSTEKRVQWKDQQASASSSSSSDDEDVVTSTIHFTHTKTHEKQPSSTSDKIASPADIYNQYKAMQPVPGRSHQPTSVNSPSASISASKSSASATASSPSRVSSTQSTEHPVKSIMKPARPPLPQETVQEKPPKQILPQLDSVFSGNIVERSNSAMPTQAGDQPMADEPPKRVSKFKAARQQQKR